MKTITFSFLLLFSNFVLSQNNLNSSQSTFCYSIQSIEFEFNSFDIKKDENRKIESLVKYFQEIGSEYKISIIGHTDFFEGNNVKLALKRAISIENRLIESGLPVDQFFVLGVGDKYLKHLECIEGNCPEWKSVENRRVSFKFFSDKDGDGIDDLADECPEEVGPLTNNGCSMPTTPISEDYVEEYKEYIRPVFFLENSLYLNDNNIEILKANAEVIRNHPTYKFNIIGFANMFEEKKEILAIKRAELVRAEMINLGVNDEQLIVKEEELKPENNRHVECIERDFCPEWKHFENRRVIFKVVP